MLKKVATFIWLGYGNGGSGLWAVGALERLNLVCISRMRSMYQGSLTPMPGIEQLSPGYGQPWVAPTHCSQQRTTRNKTSTKLTWNFRCLFSPRIGHTTRRGHRQGGRDRHNNDRDGGEGGPRTEQGRDQNGNGRYGSPSPLGTRGLGNGKVRHN